jgi:regulator of nucleoside diphosphate kinase
VERLRSILGPRSESQRDREHLLELRDELEQAHVVADSEIAADVVRLDSHVRVSDGDTGVSHDYTVVVPTQANVASSHISVLAPLGTALLGYREGDEIEWRMPGGVRRLQIKKVRQMQDPALDNSGTRARAVEHAGA